MPPRSLTQDAQYPVREKLCVSGIAYHDSDIVTAMELYKLQDVITVFAVITPSFCDV